MDKVKQYQKIITDIFHAHKGMPTRDFPNLQDIIVIDNAKQHFLFFTVGWDRDKYHHTTIYHLELKVDGKIWVHAYNADERLEEDLLSAGIKKTDIIGGMLAPYELEKMQTVNEVGA